MLRKPRGMSPFKWFWILFYTLVIAAQIVPWDVGKWLAYIAFTPSAIAALILAVMTPLLIVWCVWEWAVKLYRGKAHNPESGL